MDPRRRLRRETALVIAALVVPLVMTNPPIIGLVNAYATAHPLTLGFPTIWMWLELWYAVMLVELAFFAKSLPSWQAHSIEQRIEEVTERRR